MNLSNSITQFHPQHKNKCYCRSGNFCCCTGSKDSFEIPTSTHKFIKLHQDGNRIKSSLSGTYSPSVNRSSAATQMTSVSASSILHGAPSSEPRLTQRREFYERSQGVLSQKIDVRVVGTTQQLPQIETEWFSDEQIAKLQEFRLRNADECLSTFSRYSMEREYRSKDLKEVAEMMNEKYTINKRGLLEMCNDRGLTVDMKNGAPVALVADSKIAAKHILRQKLKTLKEKDNFLRKALCIPDNSLALSYQKTY